MQIAIIQRSKLNHVQEMAAAISRTGMQPINFFWNESPENCADFAGFIIVDDFFDINHMQIIHMLQQQSELGKPILGVGLGATLLVKTGLVPGLSSYQTAIELTKSEPVQHDQKRDQKTDEWVYICPSTSYQLNAFTRQIKPDTILHLPRTHSEGRFVIPPGLLLEMQLQGMVVFQYCDEQGDILEMFPMQNIAAVSNRMGNVMAMIPHLEHTLQGDLIFHSMREYIQQGHVERVLPLNYQPR